VPTHQSSPAAIVVTDRCKADSNSQLIYYVSIIFNKCLLNPPTDNSLQASGR